MYILRQVMRSLNYTKEVIVTFAIKKTKFWLLQPVLFSNSNKLLRL